MYHCLLLEMRPQDATATHDMAVGTMDIYGLNHGYLWFEPPTLVSIAKYFYFEACNMGGNDYIIEIKTVANDKRTTV